MSRAVAGGTVSSGRMRACTRPPGRRPVPRTGRESAQEPSPHASAASATSAASADRRARGSTSAIASSVELATSIDRHARGQGRVVPVLLEVHLTDEPTKFGFPAADLEAAIERMVDLAGIRIEGLMTIAPLDAPGEAARPYFRRLRALRDRVAGSFPQLSWRHLSMGMTNDYEVAVEEGSTLVRVGRAIFGEHS